MDNRVVNDAGEHKLDMNYFGSGSPAVRLNLKKNTLHKGKEIRVELHEGINQFNNQCSSETLCCQSVC